MKKKRKLIWQIYVPYLGILVIVLSLVVLYASSAIQQFHQEQLFLQLEGNARYFGTLINNQFAVEYGQEIDRLCKSVGQQLAIRITIVLSSGLVLGDTEEDPARMVNHANRPEIQQALAGQVGTSTRFSYTLGKDLVYVAIPFYEEKTIIGVVRTSMPVKTVEQPLRLLYRQLVITGILIAGVSAIISLLISRHITKPIERIRQSALRFAHGDLTHRINIPAPEEIEVLADTMNQMSSQLAERIQTVTKQRNELEAVLENMVEAVIIVDRQERLIRCNQAAIRLFKLNPAMIGRRSIQETIRNADIQRFIKKTFEQGSPVEDVLRLYVEQERFLHVHGTSLYETEDHIEEILLVFHDITRLKQLENMRREFVANVSHELRTPITSIVGFIETLQDGAIHDPGNAGRFLSIIERNANRLNSIINDLLTLSKIEQGKENKEIALEDDRIKDVLDTAILVCKERASKHQLTILLDCNEMLRARINTPLLEQAVTNLLDNAIKYSDPGTQIQVKAIQEGQEVIISVEDSGCGIAAEHLPRLFERFYRVDKARSRTLGGTGLGLAIVKHIANAHQGRAIVESAPGKGSTFSIVLPMH